MQLVIISGIALPEIDFAWYRRKISANLTSRSNSVDDRMAVTQNQIRNISQKEYRFVDLPVSLKTEKIKFSFRLCLNRASIDSKPT